MSAIRFDQFEKHHRRNGQEMGISDNEVIDLVTAFRAFGFWRMDLAAGLFYGTPDIFDIFGMEYRDGPINLVEFRDHIHPEDIPLLMESVERVSTGRRMYHTIYRVRGKGSAYKYVRTVGRYRETANGNGEIVGVTYAFFEPLRTAAFCELPADGD